MNLPVLRKAGVTSMETSESLPEHTRSTASCEEEEEVQSMHMGLAAARKVSDPKERARMRFREAVLVVMHQERIKRGETTAQGTGGDKFAEAIRALVAKKRAEQQGLFRKGLGKATEIVKTAKEGGQGFLHQQYENLGPAKLSPKELRTLKKEFDSVDKAKRGLIDRKQLEKIQFRRAYQVRKEQHHLMSESLFMYPSKQLQVDRNTAATTANTAFEDLPGLMDFECFCRFHQRLSTGVLNGGPSIPEPGFLGGEQGLVALVSRIKRALSMRSLSGTHSENSSPISRSIHSPVSPGGAFPSAQRGGGFTVAGISELWRGLDRRTSEPRSWDNSLARDMAGGPEALSTMSVDAGKNTSASGGRGIMRPSSSGGNRKDTKDSLIPPAARKRSLFSRMFTESSRF